MTSTPGDPKVGELWSWQPTTFAKHDYNLVIEVREGHPYLTGSAGEGYRHAVILELETGQVILSISIMSTSHRTLSWKREA